jgi:protein-disulfide isomerase
MPEESSKKKTVVIRVPHVNIWMIATLVLAVLLIVVYLGGTGEITGLSVKVTGLSANDAANKAIDYINKNLVQTGTATFVSVKETNGVYEVTTAYQGQDIPIYVTKDGILLFVSQPINTGTQVTTTTTQPTVVPKNDKPTVELFVMGFCPYGVQAETLMKPVFDLLGNKTDITVRFITSISGDTVDSVQSLHGTTEAQEDLRQVCIMNNYDQKTYWTYLMEIDNNCYGKVDTTNAAALDTCWKAAATKAGIDAAKIETCSSGSEGLNLLKADEQLTSQYGVSGSPTLVINGVTYNGARSSEAFKQAICNAFNTAPAECYQALSDAGGTASGGC